MSRSYKRTPMLRMPNGNRKFGKKYANHLVRTRDYEVLPTKKGNSYKKFLVDPIDEYKEFYSEREAIKFYNLRKANYKWWHKKFFKQFPTVDDYIKWCRKTYINK